MESLPRDIIKKILARVFYNYYCERYGLYSGYNGLKLPTCTFFVNPLKSIFRCFINLCLVCRSWNDCCEELTEKKDYMHFRFKKQIFVYL